MRVEIIDRQVAVRLNDDRSRVRFDRARVDFVRKPFLDDDRVVVERFRLRKQIADSDAFAGAAHAEQDRVLRRFVSFGTGERRHADQIPLSAFVKRFRVFQMTGERRAEWQHVCEITRFRVELAMWIAAPGTTGPALVKKFLGGGRKRASEILRTIHSVDRVLDRRGFHGEPFSRLVPCANDVFDVEWQRVSLHQRGDFLLLLFHRREQREALLTREVASQAIVRFLFAPDLQRERRVIRCLP